MEDITLVKDALHRPDEPRHFMEIKHPRSRFTAFIKGEKLADSTSALKLCEVGYHIYDPVMYFPLEDVNMQLLRQTEKTTHCPLKGDTAYFDYVNGDAIVKDVGWNYVKTLPLAEALRAHIAFDPKLVTLAEE